MNNPYDQFPIVDPTYHSEMPVESAEFTVPFLPDVDMAEEMNVSMDFMYIDVEAALEVLEATEAAKATTAEMGRRAYRGTYRRTDLDMDGRLHDAPDNDRGVEEDAAFEATLDSLAPVLG